MNKYLFILGLVGTALFTACSTADDLVPEKPIETPPVEEPKETTLLVEARQNSEIPITLGVGQSRGITRAPFPNDASFDTPSGQYIGVFCLATDYQSSNHPIENKWSADDETGLNVRMKNIPAKVEDGNVTFLDPENTSSEKSYYYPMSNWMKYNFYAYYPWQATTASNLEFNSTNQQVWEKYFAIDGSQDIIYGKADPTQAVPVTSEATDADPYCAKYSRLKKAEGADEGDYLPQLKFNHKLVQFKFQVKVLNEAVYDVIDDINVTDMYINNGIYQLALIVADKNTPANDGNLYWFTPKRNLKKMNIKASDSDDDLFINGNKLTFDKDDADRLEPQAAGYIMLAPPNLPGRNYIGKTPEEVEEEYRQYFNPVVYQLVVKMNYKMVGSGDEEENTLYIDLDPSVVGQFEAGKLYNIIVNIQSPEKISVKAVLAGWDESPEAIQYNN